MSELNIEPYEIDIINTYRAWGDFDFSEDERRRAEPTGEAIDCDLAPIFENPIVFDTIDEVRTAIDGLIETLPSDASEKLGSKLLASKTYLDVEYGGARPDYVDYINATMGGKPTLFDIDPRGQEAEELDARLREFGLGWDEQFRDEYRRVSAAFTDENGARKRFAEAIDRANGILAGYNPGGTTKVTPRLEYDYELSKASTYTKDGIPIVEFSIHEDHEWSEGEVDEVSLHEMTHVGHLDVVAEAVNNGTLRPAEGVTTIHTPEMTHFESLGLLASLAALRNERTPISEFQRLYSVRAFKVRSNAGYMINTGYTEEEVEAYVREKLPLDPVEDLLRSIVSRRDNQLDKAYHGAYALGIEMVAPVLEMPIERQDRIVRALFTTFMSAQEVSETISRTK